MGLFDSRRQRKEIEKLERDLNNVRSQIKKVEQSIESAKADYKTVRERTTKVFEDELEQTRRNCGEEAAKAAKQSVINCENELSKLGYGITVNNAAPIINQLERVMPETAIAMRNAMPLRVWMANPTARKETYELTQLWEIESQIKNRLQDLK